MQVLVEFTYELEDRVKSVGHIILSEIYRIYSSEDAFTVKTRTSAIEILNSILKCANMHIDPKDQLNFFNPILPAFMEKMLNGLTSSNSSNFHLKTEILKVVTYMVSEMPKFSQPFMTTMLPTIYFTLTQMADIYIKSIVNECVADPFEGNEGMHFQFIMFIEIRFFFFEFFQMKRIIL